MKATFQATTSSKLNLPSLSLCTTETLLNKLSGFQRFPSAAELSARYSREDLRILAYRELNLFNPVMIINNSLTAPFRCNLTDNV